jgi:hypothetical protein
MMENPNKILAFPLTSDDPNCVCSNCRQLELRWQRSLKLHAETTVQLAQCETQLVEAKRQIRELKSGVSAS